MRFANRGIGHDRGRVLKKVADIAVLIQTAGIVLVDEVPVKLISEIGPGDARVVQRIADLRTLDGGIVNT